MTTARNLTIWAGLLVLLAAVGMGSKAAAAEDVTTPRLLSATLETPGPFAPGDTIRVNYTAEDDLEPGGDGTISQVRVYFNTPTGGQLTLETSMAAAGQNALTVMELEVPAYAAAGTYTLNYVEVLDPRPNAIFCDQEGYTGFGGFDDTVVATNPCPATLALDFVINNANEDIDPPVLDSQPGFPVDTYESGQQVTVNYSASDATSDVVNVQFIFEHRNAQDVSDYISFGYKIGPGAGAGPVKFNVAPEMMTGDYRFVQVRLYDEAENGTIYFADGTVTYSPSGLTGPTTHSFDFSPAFHVNNGGRIFDIYPRTATKDAGIQPFFMLVTGAGFTEESQVNFELTALETQFIDDKHLLAAVPATAITTRPVGTYGIRVSYGDLPVQAGPPGVTFPLEARIFAITLTSTADANEDGCVTARDALDVMRSIAGLDPIPTAPPPCQASAGAGAAPRVVLPFDADWNGSVGISDVVHIQRVVAGYVPE